MFFKRDKMAIADSLLQAQSEAHKGAAMKQQFSFRYEVKQQDEQLSNVVANMNDALAMYEQHEQTLQHKLNILMGVQHFGF